MTGGVLVLCMYRARNRKTYEPVKGAIVIEVVRSADILREFDYRMWQRQQTAWLTDRLEGWQLTSYLPACGTATF